MDLWPCLQAPARRHDDTMLIDAFAPEREFSLVRTAVVEADIGDAMAAV